MIDKQMEIAKSLFYFFLAGICEIGGFIALVGVAIIMYAPRG
ncbi:MAG TPA: hypothetical protein VN381_11570 [Anaerovoracaceae bacterium]|nr:hypothetical protein [Anaerovoracaceae bacterium]